MMREEDKLRSALGFAMKAGKIKSGELAAEQSIRSGRALVAVVDEAVSERSRKRWSDMCENAGIPIVFASEIGRAIGKEAHTVVCVQDKGFAQMILRSRQGILS